MKTSFKTILELLISYHSANFENKEKIVDKKLNFEMGSKKSFMEKSEIKNKSKNFFFKFKIKFFFKLMILKSMMRMREN